MIFEKKDYIAPGIVKSLWSQSYLWVTGPWKKLQNERQELLKTIQTLQRYNIPILINSKLASPCATCAQCLQVCPTQCLSMLGAGKTASFKINLLNCISCAKCAEVCPEKILIMRDVGVGPGPLESEWNLELIGFVPARTEDKSE